MEPGLHGLDRAAAVAEARQLRTWGHKEPVRRTERKIQETRSNCTSI
jgi:hypothetical protein